MSTHEIRSVLVDACTCWLDHEAPERLDAVTALAHHYRVSEAAIASVLDAAFGEWTEEALTKWVALELGDEGAIDDFTTVGSVRRRAWGPNLLLVLSARGVPTTPIADILAALSVKAPVWIKPAAGADDLAERFASTLAARHAGVGDAVEISTWNRGAGIGAMVLSEADVVVATGSDQTVSQLRRAVGPQTHLVFHGPRLSIAVLARDVLTGDPEGAVADLAHVTAFAGQQGCLSPVVAYLECSWDMARDLVAPIQRACELRWPCAPRREGSASERAAFVEWSTLVEVEKAAGREEEWIGNLDGAWTVKLLKEAEPPNPPVIPRLLVLAPVTDLDDVARLCERRRGTIATAGIAASRDRLESLALRLAEAGVERVTPLGAMQRPPLAWRRDGRPILADLVRWVDVES